nr:unnamed protein product [Haemonchus contortus]
MICKQSERLFQFTAERVRKVLRALITSLRLIGEKNQSSCAVKTMRSIRTDQPSTTWSAIHQSVSYEVKPFSSSLMMAVYTFIAPISILVLATFGQQNGSEITLAYRRLYSDLFDKYNSMLPSVFTKRFLLESLTKSRWESNNGLFGFIPKTHCAIEIIMMTIIDVDDSNQLIRSILEYRLRWTDPRLTWKPADYAGLSHITAPTHKVWTPAVFAANIMQSEAVADQDTFPDNLIISSNGDILRVFSLSVLFTCTIQSSRFPFDTQQCYLDFAEYIMDPSETDLSLTIIKDAIFNGNGEWALENITIRTELVSNGVEPYYSVSMVFEMHRLSTYYVTLMIIPIQLITNISVFALFWISDAGFIDQTVVTLSSLTSLLVLTDILDSSVPKTSEIPNAAKHIWWNIAVMTIALCDTRLLTFLKKNDLIFHLQKSGTSVTQSFMAAPLALLGNRIIHLLLFQVILFLSLIVFIF